MAHSIQRYPHLCSRMWRSNASQAWSIRSHAPFLVEEAWLQPEAEPWVDLQPSLINQERELIEAALAETRGRISGPDEAARRLGVPRTTLESKIKSLRIDKYRYRVEARELLSRA